MRAHSNYVENTAFMLILLILAELGTGSSIWLWGAGAPYLVRRVLHALGMDGMMWGRLAGAIITILPQFGPQFSSFASVFNTTRGNYPTVPCMVKYDSG